MKALYSLILPKTKPAMVNNVLLQRLRFFLLHDLVPSLIMLIILSICTSFVAEKIYQAKASRSHTISMILGSSDQNTSSVQVNLKP